MTVMARARLLVLEAMYRRANQRKRASSWNAATSEDSNGAARGKALAAAKSSGWLRLTEVSPFSLVHA